MIARTYPCAYSRTCLCIHPCTYSRIHPCIYLCIYLCIYPCTCLCTHSRIYPCFYQSSFICSFLWAVLWLRKVTYDKYLFSYSRVSINYVPGIYQLHVSHSLVICQAPISYIPGIRWLFISYFKRHFQIAFVRNFSWILPVQCLYRISYVSFSCLGKVHMMVTCGGQPFLQDKKKSPQGALFVRQLQLARKN